MTTPHRAFRSALPLPFPTRVAPFDGDDQPVRCLLDRREVAPHYRPIARPIRHIVG